jgi:hypothetical protein
MSSQVINVYNEDGSHQEKLVDIQWPAIVTMIHPNDTSGEHFPTILDVFYSLIDSNSFAAWTLLGCIGLVPEI